MQAFRRLYSSIPDTAKAARTASTPRAVRLRRLRKRPAVAAGEHDATPEGLTPSEHTRFQRSLAKGEAINEDGSYLAEGDWLAKLDARRQRIRGVRQVTNEDGEKELQVVGQKVYLPNIVFTLVRNHTPQGQPYNPFEATFRIPQSITKTDIRSYLAAVYGVKTTYIRTDNYSPKQNRFGDIIVPGYKRAVVGLVEPFYYPEAMEDMNEEDRSKREAWLEEHFSIKQKEQLRQLELLRLTRAHSQGWKWRTGATARRSNIMRLIAERRAEREMAIEEAKTQMREEREAVKSQS